MAFKHQPEIKMLKRYVLSVISCKLKIGKEYLEFLSFSTTVPFPHRHIKSSQLFFNSSDKQTIKIKFSVNT